jgi:peptide/nickel transport system substrate-binding protein
MLCHRASGFRCLSGIFAKRWKEWWNDAGRGYGSSLVQVIVAGFAVTLSGAVSAADSQRETLVLPEVQVVRSLQESAYLAEAVAAGRLPAVAERVPAAPLVVQRASGQTIGKPGGSVRTLIAREKDIRLLVVYGYARLVGYDEKLELVPDILEKVEIEDDRIFTFHLRKGHKWSDGHPFTTEDFRYYWEDVANNDELTPSGPTTSLAVEGEFPAFEVIDEVTVRYSWSRSNPFFLTRLAGARPLFIYQPAHYMKRYHGKYAEADKLAKRVEHSSARDWAQLHNRQARQYRFSNPELPTLQPWMNTIKPPSTRFIGVRNPFYHRIDETGQQLPYLDEMIMTVVASSLIPAKVGAGEADLQSRGLNFNDYTFLKENHKRSAYDVRLWKTVRGSQLALYPNLNTNDPEWRKLFRDVRFRRAISMATNRHEINQAIYYGLCIEGNNTVLPASPLYQQAYRDAWANFDLEAAGALLDELGLTARDSEGIRLLPDGRPMEIIVETAGENTEESDVLELIRDSWREVGIKLFTKPSQREVLRKRIFSGETVMTMWFGYENGVPTADMSPDEFVPLHQQSYQWPMWGQYHETSGMSGEPVDLPLAQELLEQHILWTTARSRAERAKIWHRILEIHADQVYTIGIVAQVPQPVVVANDLRNVPVEGIYNWEPGALFGIYRPDRFWLDRD